MSIDYNGEQYKMKIIKDPVSENEYWALDLSSKKINDILSIKGLKRLQKLEYLDLQDNQIREIKGFDTLTNLKILVLSKNKISEIKNLENLVKLEELYLDNNEISELKGLGNLMNLNALTLSKNPIYKFLLKNFKAVNFSYKNSDQFDNLIEYCVNVDKTQEKEEMDNRDLIKKTILDLGTKFARLLVIEIAEECGVNNDLIISTIKEMIERQEIYAKYFESSQSVAFNQQANIDDIDKLMEAYKEWEDEGVGKM